MTQFEEQLFKVLSRNDTGETGGHQSGISIPKNVASSSIFPKMSKLILNPRREVSFTDEGGKEWNLQYIYYNDKYHGKHHQIHQNIHAICQQRGKLTCGQTGTNNHLCTNPLYSSSPAGMCHSNYILNRIIEK